MKSKAIIKAILMAACVCLLLAACSPVEPIQTPIGSFDYSQKFVTSLQNRIDDTQGEVYMPQQGKIFLVVYMMPAGGSSVSLDDAQSYFQRGTNVILDGETFGLYSLAFERVDGISERIGLVFEVKDKGYADTTEQPLLKLELPSTP